jgi:hypothetical protein
MKGVIRCPPGAAGGDCASPCSGGLCGGFPTPVGCAGCGVGSTGGGAVLGADPVTEIDGAGSPASRWAGTGAEGRPGSSVASRRGSRSEVRPGGRVSSPTGPASPRSESGSVPAEGPGPVRPSGRTERAGPGKVAGMALVTTSGGRRTLLVLAVVGRGLASRATTSDGGWTAGALRSGTFPCSRSVVPAVARARIDPPHRAADSNVGRTIPRDRTGIDPSEPVLWDIRFLAKSFGYRSHDRRGLRPDGGRSNLTATPGTHQSVIAQTLQVTNPCRVLPRGRSLRPRTTPFPHRRSLHVV